MADYDERMSEITQLHEEEKFIEIIKRIEEIPKEEWDYELTGYLARAYNNIGEYEKALTLLLSVEEEGRHDLIWHFRIGYSYYYLEQLEAAEKSFTRVLQSDPGDSGALEFLNAIRMEMKEIQIIKHEQEKAAMAQMKDWLHYESEVKQKPAEIEQTGEFDLHGLHYYIYKYKIEKETPWLLGVCGGFERFDLENSGHTFSEMKKYSPKKAEEDAVKIIEKIRAESQNETKTGFKKYTTFGENGKIEYGPFLGSVLLNSYHFDAKEIKTNLKHDWNILISDDENDMGKSDGFFFEYNGMIIVINYIEAPIFTFDMELLDGMGDMEEEAVEVAKTHVAQVIITVLEKGRNPIDVALLYTKVASSCLKMENAVGFCTTGTIFQPDDYIDMAETIHDGNLPVLNWVHIGMAETEKGVSAYTYGFHMFGKDEIEIIDSQKEPEIIYLLLIDLIYYVLLEDITLSDGETIGFPDFQNVKITKSKGVFLEEDTIKIEL